MRAPNLAWRAFCLIMVTGFLTSIPVAHADDIYTFQYTATSGNIQSFSFSLSAPAPLGGPPNSSPSFTPFNITDGTNTWSLSQDLLSFDTSPNLACFDFGTSTASLFNCGFGGGNPNGVLFMNFAGGLPSSPGLYVPTDFGGDFVQGPTDETISSLSGSFTVNLTSSAPEPSGLFLLGSGLLGVFGIFWRRNRQTTGTPR